MKISKNENVFQNCSDSVVYWCGSETKNGSFLYGKRIFIENQYDIDNVQCVGVVCGLSCIWILIPLRITLRLKSQTVQ